MRDVARKGSKRHQKPDDAKQKQKERHDDERQKQTRPGGSQPSAASSKTRSTPRLIAGIDEGADCRRPGQGLARKNRLFDDVRMLMQEPRRAIGEFAEQIEDDQSGKDRQSVAAETAALGRRRNADRVRKYHRIGGQHDERPEDRPNPAKDRTRETGPPIRAGPRP